MAVPFILFTENFHTCSVLNSIIHLLTNMPGRRRQRQDQVSWLLALLSTCSISFGPLIPPRASVPRCPVFVRALRSRPFRCSRVPAFLDLGARLSKA